MSESKIEPALTPEQWAKVEAFADGGALDNLLGVRRFGWTADVAKRDDTERPARAAIALYGRITWEMVDALEMAALTDHPRCQCPHCVTVKPTLMTLRDLLESLLPPRAP